MIREPYNITPYNSTIDTSRINEFGFNFSGDELGSWQAEVAKNNSSPEVLFTSKQYYPVDAGYDRIFDGDRVEGTLVPSWIKATNSGKYDGEIKRLYSISDENVPTQGSNVKVFIQKKIGTTEAGDIYETVAVGERRIVNNNDSNIIYFAFNTEYIFEESSNKYYISYKVDNAGETEPAIKSFSFVGYLLIADNKNNRINFSSGDAVQIEDIVFIPSINAISLGDYLEIYLLNQEGKNGSPPDYLSVDKYITYYIFTYNGTENDIYSGDEIVIDDIVSGTINSFVAEFEPYQEGEFWGPGMGVNKFNIEYLGNQNDLSSNEVWYNYTSWPPVAVPKATADVSFTSENNTLSFDITIGNYDISLFNSDSLSFYFNEETEVEGENELTSLLPHFKKGTTYYLQSFDDTAIPSSITNFYLIVDYRKNYFGRIPEQSRLYLANTSGLNIPETGCAIIGFGFTTSVTNTTIQIDLDDIVISENSSVTEYSAYSNPYRFKSYDTFLLKNSNSNILEASIDPQNNFYGGIFDKNGKLYKYNYIRSYDGENLENFRWWSSYEKFTPGTNPSLEAEVIYKQEVKTTPITPNVTGSLPSNLSTSSENIITIIGQRTAQGSFSKKGTFQELNTTQSPDKSVVALRRAVGEDLIWRLKMWEPEGDETRTNPNITNFVKRGRF